MRQIDCKGYVIGNSESENFRADIRVKLEGWCADKRVDLCRRHPEAALNLELRS
jgi:hypothetical protein